MRGRWNAGAILILGLVSLLWLALGPPPSALAASASASGPTLSVAQTSVSMQVRKDGLFDSRSDVGQAIGSILVSSLGKGRASIQISGYYSDGTGAGVTFHRGVPSAAPFPNVSPVPAVPVRSNGSQPIAVSFNWTRTSTTTGWLVVADKAHPSQRVLVPFQVKEIIPGAVLARVFGYAAAIAAGLIVIVALSLRSHKPLNDLTEGPTWSFKDSWASNFVALGSALGTIFAASGFLADFLPGLSTGMFVGFSLAYGALVLIAPLVFQTLSWKGAPTYRGLLVAGAIVLWAVVGELGTAVELLNRGGLAPAAGWLAFVASVIVLGFYTRASIVPVITAPSPPKVDTVAAASSAAGVAAALATAEGRPDEDVRAAATAAATNVIEATTLAPAAAPLAAEGVAGRVPAGRARPAAML